MSLAVVGSVAVFTGVEVRAGAAVHIEGGTVQSVDPGPGPATGPDEGSTERTVLDASGCIITPGLVNAHHHLLQTAFRGLPGSKHTRMADWLGVMAAAYRAAGVDAELTAAAASVGIAEGLLSGVTTTADHHLTWPEGVEAGELARATAASARSLGARLAFVRGTAGGDPETAALSAEALVSDLGVVDGVTADGMVQLAVGPAGVHSDGPEMFAAFREVARRHGLRRRTQANEQVDVERAAARYGRRPLELLDEWGWLEPDVTIAHCCDIDRGEVDLLGRAGVTVTHAPGCDIPSGWGVAPVSALLAAGVEVGLGTSGGGSNDAGHLLADARLALQVAPLSALSGRVVTALDVLAMATRGSATGLGRAELGRLGPGSAADLCCWAVDDVHDAGVDDRVAGLLWANPGRRPRHVVVNGRVVVRDGELIVGCSRELAGRLAALLRRRGLPGAYR